MHDYVKNNLEKYNRAPGLFPLTNNNSYFDTLEGKNNDAVLV